MQPRQTDHPRRNNQPFATFLEIACDPSHPRHVPAVGQLRPYPRSSATNKPTFPCVFSISQEKAENGSGLLRRSAVDGPAVSDRGASLSLQWVASGPAGSPGQASSPLLLVHI